MGFRDERSADRYRIDALEDEVAAKDDEIERLRAELTAKQAPKPSKQQKKKKKRAPADIVPVVDDLPSGDVMSLDTHDQANWKVGVVWLVVAAIVFGVLGVRQGLGGGLLAPMAIFGLPGFFFLIRTRLVIDRKARTITRVWTFLLSVRRTLSVEGQELVLERRAHHPKNGKTWYGGHLLLGERPLASMKIGKARVMAKRGAAFMDVMGAIMGLLKLVGVIP